MISTPEFQYNQETIITARSLLTKAPHLEFFNADETLNWPLWELFNYLRERYDNKPTALIAIQQGSYVFSVPISEAFVFNDFEVRDFCWDDKKAEQWPFNHAFWMEIVDELIRLHDLIGDMPNPAIPNSEKLAAAIQEITIPVPEGMLSGTMLELGYEKYSSTLSLEDDLALLQVSVQDMQGRSERKCKKEIAAALHALLAPYNWRITSLSYRLGVIVIKLRAHEGRAEIEAMVQADLYHQQYRQSGHAPYHAGE